MGKFYKAIVTILGCFTLYESAYGGAWNQKAGEGQVISTSVWGHANRIFDDDFEAIPLTGFTKVETRFYVEQGITDWLTFVGNSAIQTLNFRDDESQFDFEGLDDVELGMQFRMFAKEGFSSSMRLSYIFDSQLDGQVADILGGGDQFELRGLIGQSRETVLGDFFYDAQIALRTEDFERLNGGEITLTGGFKPTHLWLTMVQLYANLSEIGEVDGFDVPKQLQINTQISLARKYKPGRYVQFGFGKTIFGQNIVKERSVFMGLWVEY